MSTVMEPEWVLAGVNVVPCDGYFNISVCVCVGGGGGWVGVHVGCGWVGGNYGLRDNSKRDVYFHADSQWVVASFLQLGHTTIALDF